MRQGSKRERVSRETEVQERDREAREGVSKRNRKTRGTEEQVKRKSERDKVTGEDGHAH